MIKCPKCGSTAQVKEYNWDIGLPFDTEIVITRNYLCKGCAHLFDTIQSYEANSREIVYEEEDE
jgi:C4-type Zn-finger protein